jgi:hypothetical protein
MNKHERNEQLQRYENGPQLLAQALNQYPRHMWKYKPAHSKWSIHEILIHLSDSEIQSHVRCRMILAEPGSTISNHDEHQWSVGLNYLDRDVDEAIEAIELMRRLNNQLLKSVADSSWLNFCIHSARGKMTLEDWLVTYAAHIPHHIDQLTRTYDHWRSAALSSDCDSNS